MPTIEASRGPDGRRHFFRGHRDVADIFALLEAKKAAGTFEPYVNDPFEHGIEFDPEIDVDSACGESCEIGADAAYTINAPEEEEEEDDEDDFGAHSIPPPITI